MACAREVSLDSWLTLYALSSLNVWENQRGRPSCRSGTGVRLRGFHFAFESSGFEAQCWKSHFLYASVHIIQAGRAEGFLWWDPAQTIEL